MFASGFQKKYSVNIQKRPGKAIYAIMFLTSFKTGSKTFYVQSATIPANNLRNPRQVTSRKWIRLLANISFGATNHSYKVVQLYILQKLLSWSIKIISPSNILYALENLLTLMTVIMDT